MAKKIDTRNKRIALQLNPPIDGDALSRLWRCLYEHMQAEFVVPLSSDGAQNRYECTLDIARRYSPALTIYAETRARGLPDSAHDPDEYADYFNDKSEEIKSHAASLLALLKNNRAITSTISQVIGGITQMRQLPDGNIGSFTQERSLVERLDELVKSIKLPEAGAEQVTKQKGRKGEGAARAHCIRAVLHMWIEIGGADVKFRREHSAGTSHGPFNSFAVSVLEIFGIKNLGLETFVREAEDLFKGIPDSHLERLRNQYRVKH